MTVLSILWKSLWNRKLTSILTVSSIALSVMLLLGIERIRQGARDSFSGTISQTDLIVGAKGGTIQLLLYSVFRIGSATNNVSFGSYEKWSRHPAVLWTIPYSLGDSHRGFRVVGTNENFYEHYRFRQDKRVSFSGGRAPADVFEVVLGSDVAEKLGYQIGQKIAVTHGVTDGVGFLNHDDKPFTVVGTLAKTGTPIDRSLYVTLEGLEAIHMDWKEGVPPRPGEEIPATQLTKQNIKIGQITAFLVRTKNRFETLGLQRELNTFPDEPMMAIIPGVALSELWSIVSYAEDGLRLVSWSVLLVGLIAMLIALYTSLQERRREMAILRSLGASLSKIAFFLVTEACLLTMTGVVLGIALTYGALSVLQPIIERSFGLLIPIQPLSALEWIFVGVILFGGLLIGLVPAIKACRNSLADGLAVRFILPLFLLIPPSVSEAKTLKIASSVAWLHEVAREITCGGQGVELLPPLIAPGTDPHGYRLTPRARLTWNSADLRLLIGQGFEPWDGQRAAKSSQVFIATGKLTLRKTSASPATKELVSNHSAHSHAATHSSSAKQAGEAGVINVDPHIWHSPQLTRDTAQNLYDFLIEKAPAQRAGWEICLRSFLKKTKDAEKTIREKFSVLSPIQRVLATNHDALGYFAEAFGFQVITLSGVSTEATVTPVQLKRAMEKIKSSGAKAIFLEHAMAPDLVRKVAAELKIRMGGELFTDGLTAAQTPAGTITGLWETNTETILAALKP
jgi:putative ABC transport system permease protein